MLRNTREAALFCRPESQGFHTRCNACLGSVAEFGAGALVVEERGNAAKCDVGSKMLHLAWHPTQDVIACANANALYMYANMPPRRDDRP